MEKLAINRNSLVKQYTKMDVSSFRENGGALEITVPQNTIHMYNVGDSIFLRRRIDCSGRTEMLSKRMVVCAATKTVGTSKIITTLPFKDMLIASSTTQYRQINAVDFSEWGNANDKIYTIIQFLNEHHIYAQDIVDNGGSIPLHAYNSAGDDIGTVYACGVPTYYVDSAVSKSDTYSYVKEETCGKPYDYYITSAYTFLPDSFSRKSLIVTGVTASIRRDAVYYQSEYNEFYKKSNVIYSFWEDPWINIDYDIEGEYPIGFFKDTYFWNIPVSLHADETFGMLEAEDHFNSSLVDDVAYASMPDIIDMEKVRYSPSIKSLEPLNNGNIATYGAVAGTVDAPTTVGTYLYNMVTGITIIPHFRERCEITSANTESTKDNRYADGWYLGPYEKQYGWWNGAASLDSNTFSEASIKQIMERSQLIPDGLKYLNFTDSDVYYRKATIKKSFYRLSFFDSKDPLNGKLLFTSTISLDAGELYGNFIKQKALMESLDMDTTGKTSVVSYNGNNTVTSQVTTTGENDSTKRGEGFNLYLFSDDAPLGNATRTIYMKVEFFHAGNGKTIPLIMWPKNALGKYVALTNNNQIDSLYIPVEIAHINNRFVYCIPDAINNNDERTITLSLYEPRITQEEK